MYCINCGEQLPDSAKFCMSCGKRIEKLRDRKIEIELKESDCDNTVNNKIKETSADFRRINKETLKSFRKNAISNVGHRDDLLELRKSLSNFWDYNAYVGILLGVAGPKHGDIACKNYAIGQGDNGNNTKIVLTNRGLDSVFEKYKGKNIDDNIFLADVEDEIISIVPEFSSIREKFHGIIDNKGTVADEIGDEHGMGEIKRKSSSQISPKGDGSNITVNGFDIYEHIQNLLDSCKKNQPISEENGSNSYSVYGYESTCDRKVLGQNFIRDNFVEYKGYVIYLKREDNKTVGIYRYTKGVSDTEKCIYTIQYLLPSNVSGIESPVCLRTCSNPEIGMILSVSNGKIYCTDGKSVISMGLSGEEVEKIDFAHPVWINLCIKVGKSVVCGFANSDTLYKCWNGDKEKINFKKSELCGFTENGWMNFNNKVLFNVDTGENIKINKQYNVKNKAIVYVNIDRKIVYTFEQDESNYLNSRIVGMDCNGNIVDEWKVPQLSMDSFNYLFGKDNYTIDYSALYFNGKRMVLNLNKGIAELEKIEESAKVIEYDRQGKAKREIDIKQNVGGLFSISENSTAILMQDSQSYEYYIVSLDVCGENTYMHKLERFC